jgi:hypothetical protein
MLRAPYAAFLILAAGCEAVPDLTFVSPEAGLRDSGADVAGDAEGGAAVSLCGDSGAAGGLCCGTTMCINPQQPEQCSCADCNQLHCTGGKICCVDIQGMLTCKPIVSCH